MVIIRIDHFDKLTHNLGKKIIINLFVPKHYIWLFYWMNEWINKWMNEWMNECINDFISQG